MLDLHPDVVVAVPTPDGPRMRPITKLLPDTCVFPDADAQRVFRLNKRYYEAVAEKTKASSVRWDETWTEGPVLIYFEDDDRPPMPADLTTVQRYRLDELTPDRLRISPEESVADYVDGLRHHYPAMPDDAVVEVVDFSLR